VVRAVAVLLLAGLGCAPSPSSRQEPGLSPSPAPAGAPGVDALPDSLAKAHELLASRLLQALGNEPFWSVEITRQAIVYRTPDEPQGIVFPYAAPSGRAGGLVFESLRSDSAPRAIRVVIEPRECSDGMSDLRYRYASEVRLDSLELHGCARFRPPRAP
jgi:uncharacterized membrane protein